MKIVKLTVFAIIIFIFFNITAYAQTENINIGDFDNYLKEIGTDLLDELPENAKDFIFYIGGSASIKDIVKMQPEEIYSLVKEIIIKEISKPLKVLTSIIAIVIVCMFAQCFADGYMNGSMAWVFSMVSMLCCARTIVEPIIFCIKEGAAAIMECATFMLALVPTLSAIMTAGGQIATASVYSMVLFTACQVVSSIARNFFVPLLGIYLAFCITGSVVPSAININKIALTVKKIVTWSMGFVMSLLLGLLTIQTLIGSGADNITAKTTKFVIGSFVPVIGSALSDAFMATRGYIGLLKSTVGAFGIIIALITFLPILVKVILWYITVNIASYIADILGTNQLSGMLSSASMVLGLLLSILLCFILLMIVSTGIVLMVGMGAF